MIIIVSDRWDVSTTYIVEWLTYYQINFVRINQGDLDNNVAINISMSGVELESPQFILNEIGLYFYRRGNIFIASKGKNSFRSDKLIDEVNSYNIKELQVLNEFFHSYIEGGFENLNMFWANARKNKLTVLQQAAKLGIKVPETYITGNKGYLTSFVRKHGKVLFKSFTDNFIYRSNSDNVNMVYYNSIFSERDLKELPNYFPPVFSQEYIEKRWEIRTFYWFGQFFSMAIFSQSSEKTKIDMRNYDNNRCVPYKLPHSLEDKISKLMDNLMLNSGCIDLLYSQDCSYYFLEVNPVGMFGMVSEPCNYNIEKK